MFLPNPGILAAGAGVSPYDAFVAYITAQATGGATVWATNQAPNAGAYITTASAALGGVMVATSWNGSFRATAAAPCRILQHALASEAIFNDQCAAERKIFYRLTAGASRANFVGVNRNGYASQSSSDGFTYGSRFCTELIRWDGERAWKSNPSIGGAETLFEIPAA